MRLTAEQIHVLEHYFDVIGIKRAAREAGLPWKQFRATVKTSLLQMSEIIHPDCYSFVHSLNKTDQREIFLRYIENEKHYHA